MFTKLINIILTVFQGQSPVLQAIGKHGYLIWRQRAMFPVWLHLIVAALFPIYIGAHASLRRPPSARSPPSSPRRDDDARDSSVDDEDDEDTPDDSPMVEGLQPSDAILFPILAGTTLAGLYLIIKWLNDPALLNRILGWYFSALGVFGVGRLTADALNVVVTFVFPRVWSDGRQTYHIRASEARQGTKESTVGESRSMTSPLPGPLSKLRLGDGVTRSLWTMRMLLRNRWLLKAHVHGMLKVETHITLNDAVGFILGLVVVVVYNTFSKAWWLSNVMAFGFSYGTLQLLSPTTFCTGSMVLAGLFVYDIVMVFYTPMMVTVATTLDAPIKLVFPGPTRDSMLGLGDVILPGIMIALALRHDLYLHYLHQQQHVPPFSPALSPRSVHSGDLTPSTTTVDPQSKKPIYVEARGRWGERFWTRSRRWGRVRSWIAASKNPTAGELRAPTVADGARFDKVYFTAGMLGYVLGMCVTLIVMVVWEHAQPALLYLVPGVLGALWGTAWVRGELGEMWAYTEDGSMEEDGEGDASYEKGSSGVMQRHGSKSKGDEASKDLKDDITSGAMKTDTQLDQDRDGHHVFLFSLSAPRSRRRVSK